MREINQAILRGDSERLIAASFRLSQRGVNRHRAHIAPMVAAVLEAKGRTLEGDAEEALSIVREVARALTLTPEQAGAMTVLQGLSSGYYELKLKVADRLLKNAELLHGTKAKVTTTTDIRQEWAALSPPEKRERLLEMKHRLLELEAEATHDPAQGH
jgi:hypothetical protein